MGKPEGGQPPKERKGWSTDKSEEQLAEEFLGIAETIDAMLGRLRSIIPQELIDTNHDLIDETRNAARHILDRSCSILNLSKQARNSALFPRERRPKNH